MTGSLSHADNVSEFDVPIYFGVDFGEFTFLAQGIDPPS